jgi:hypothetical protein
MSLADLRRLEESVLGEASMKVGDWTFPYKRPSGTKAAQIKKIEKDIAYLSDGSSMHISYAKPVKKGDVAD